MFVFTLLFAINKLTQNIKVYFKYVCNKTIALLETKYQNSKSSHFLYNINVVFIGVFSFLFPNIMNYIHVYIYFLPAFLIPCLSITTENVQYITINIDQNKQVFNGVLLSIEISKLNYKNSFKINDNFREMNRRISD